MPKTIFIDSKNVCDRGKIDAQRIAIYFRKNGYKIIYNPKKAEIIIYNSCGYDTNKAKQCFKDISKYKDYNAEIIVLGGLPETDKKEFEKTFTGKFVSHKNLQKIDMFFPENNIKFNEIDDCNIPWLTIDSSNIYSLFKKIFIHFKITKKIYVKVFEYYLKNKIGNNYFIIGNPWEIPIDDLFYIRISWGCSFKCSYCAIQKSVGRFHSKPLDKCIDEFKFGLQKGFKIFHLTAVDPGGYGIDLGSTYPQLLEKITAIEGDYRIGLECLNPICLVKYINEIEKILKRDKIKVVSIPIQSGSRRILKMMNRFSEIETIHNAFMRLKKINPNLTLYTSCIVGYPTETWKEFIQTLTFIIENKIDMGIIHPLSIKPGTKVETIKPKISREEIEKRLRYSKIFLKQHGFKIFSSKNGIVIFARKK